MHCIGFMSTIAHVVLAVWPHSQGLHIHSQAVTVGIIIIISRSMGVMHRFHVNYCTYDFGCVGAQPGLSFAGCHCGYHHHLKHISHGRVGGASLPLSIASSKQELCL